MIRKRVILFGISLGLLLNQFMLYQNNRALCATELSHTTTYSNNKSNCEQLYGLGYWQDSNSKWYIVEIFKDSSAYKNGLQIGNEILTINGIKAKKLDYSGMKNLFNDRSGVTLEIKDNYNRKDIYNLKTSTICIPQKEQDPLYDTYWQQIYTDQGDPIEGYEFYSKLSSFSYKLTWNTKVRLAQLLKETNYWADKKIKFTNKYNACKIDKDIKICLADAVNKLSTEIAYDQEVARQNAYIQAQQQMQQQQIDALNNYAYSLRNQNINVNHSGTVNSNVYHSGTVNINNNINTPYYRW